MNTTANNTYKGENNIGADARSFRPTVILPNTNRLSEATKWANAPFFSTKEQAQVPGLSATPTTNIRNLLFQCFASDMELVSKWHVSAGKGICTCVNDTLAEMMGCDKITVFVLKNQFTGETSGYFGIEEYLGDFWLTGFFLKPEYRTPEYRIQFWQQIWKSAFKCGLSPDDGAALFSCVYAKNEPANKFLSKHGKLFREKKDAAEPHNTYIVCQ